MYQKEKKGDQDASNPPGSRFPALTIGQREWSQADLADAIVKNRLTPAEHSLVSEYLWLIGFKFIKKQLRTGELAHASASMGRPVMFKHDDQRQLSESEELRDELATEVLLGAVPNFFKNVQYWSPEKGASLTTYFFGSCKQHFKGAYLTWAKGRDRRWFSAADTAVAPWMDPNYSRSFTDQVEVEDTIRQIFDLAKSNQKPILGLLYQGYSQADAATKLGLTSKAVEGRMYQLRRQVLMAVRSGKITPPDRFTSVSSAEQTNRAA